MLALTGLSLISEPRQSLGDLIVSTRNLYDVGSDSLIVSVLCVVGQLSDFLDRSSAGPLLLFRSHVLLVLMLWKSFVCDCHYFAPLRMLSVAILF